MRFSRGIKSPAWCPPVPPVPLALNTLEIVCSLMSLYSFGGRRALQRSQNIGIVSFLAANAHDCCFCDAAFALEALGDDFLDRSRIDQAAHGNRPFLPSTVSPRRGLILQRGIPL